jgi:hypothetical protein
MVHGVSHKAGERAGVLAMVAVTQAGTAEMRATARDLTVGLCGSLSLDTFVVAVAVVVEEGVDDCFNFLGKRKTLKEVLLVTLRVVGEEKAGKRRRKRRRRWMSASS